MDRVIELPLDKKYECEIFGLGEIFEIVSIENLRKKLKKQYRVGVLFLHSNKDHSGRGLSLEELCEEAKKRDYTVVQSGFADAPPWKSSPASEVTDKKKIPFSVPISYFLFSIWIPLMERFYRKKDIAHVVYCFGQKK